MNNCLNLTFNNFFFFIFDLFHFFCSSNVQVKAKKKRNLSKTKKYKTNIILKLDYKKIYNL